MLKVVKSKIIIERQLTEVKKFNILEPSGALFLLQRCLINPDHIAGIPYAVGRQSMEALIAAYIIKIT